MLPEAAVLPLLRSRRIQRIARGRVWCRETRTRRTRQVEDLLALHRLDVRLQEATASRLTHSEFLELILQDELSVRRDRAIERHLRAACFREQKTLEDFDWDFNRSAGEFVRRHRDLLLIGPPGVGKSHLAQAIGRALVHRGCSVYYRSIFDAVRDFLHDEAFDGQDRMMAKSGSRTRIR